MAAALPAPAAEALGLEPGDDIALAAIGDPTRKVDVRLTGTYSANDPRDPFWWGHRLETGGERTIDGFAAGGRVVLGHPKTREAMRCGLAMYFETLDDDAVTEMVATPAPVTASPLGELSRTYDLAVHWTAECPEQPDGRLGVVTLTCSADRAPVPRPPSPAYLATIRTALREDVGLSPARADAYLDAIA